MNRSKCPCVFPSPTEQELATLPGRDPNTALRVFVEAGTEGYVRLQQLAYEPSTGWYVQKSFVIPGDMLSAMVPELRKADCLIPKADPRQAAASLTIPFMRLATGQDDEPMPERRRA